VSCRASSGHPQWRAEALDLIACAHNNRLEVEGLSFHVGSQCTNIQNYLQALELAAGIFSEAQIARLFNLKLLDIAGACPAHYDDTVPPSGSWPERSTRNWTASSRRPSRFSQSLGGFWWLLPPLRLLQIIARPFADGKLCYYINDGVYQTYSGTNLSTTAIYPVKSFRNGPPSSLCRLRANV